MNIINTLLKVGFKPSEILNESDFFIPFEKDNDFLFVYKSSVENKLLCSSVSGELILDQTDIVFFYYETQKTSNLKEVERIEQFRNAESLNLVNELADKKLKPIPYFNLYEIIITSGDFKPHQNSNFKKAYQKNNKSYFIFIDEEKIGINRYNILGLVEYDNETKSEKVVKFSNLNRSVYFSNPTINTNRAVIFSSFSEMIAFDQLNNEPILMIVVKNTITRLQAITLENFIKSKYINNLYLGFEDSLDGYCKDIMLLNAFNVIQVKEKAGFFKVEISGNKKTNILFRKIKELKKQSSLENVNNLKNKDLVKIAVTETIDQKLNYVLELPKIANLLKSFFAISMKYFSGNIEFNMIKPKATKWENEEILKNDEVEKKDLTKLYKVG